MGMVVYNGDLIVAGSFYSAGGVLGDNIARWDGTQWHPMGDGLGPYIFCMTVDTISNILYAGGNVAWTGSTPVEKVAFWDGINWQQVGSGIPQVPNLQTLCMCKGELFAGAGQSIQTFPDRIKKWNGQVWQTLNSSPSDGGVYELCEFQGSLFASGTFDEIDSVCCYWALAYYTDTTTVGLQSLPTQSENGFQIYPNPANYQITLVFDEKLRETTNVSIYNTEGKTVFEQNFKTVSKEINIELPQNLKAGVYICKVIKNGFQLQQRSFVLE
ncbi:MAG: T9SS type A sorting domain-containing protein [Bacteroidetes bacterium]|nr:T9SS type A sorting domain-containing protein [Bacteroidota bacterium]